MKKTHSFIILLIMFIRKQKRQASKSYVLYMVMYVGWFAFTSIHWIANPNLLCKQPSWLRSNVVNLHHTLNLHVSQVANLPPRFLLYWLMSLLFFSLSVFNRFFFLIWFVLSDYVPCVSKFYCLYLSDIAETMVHEILVFIVTHNVHTVSYILNCLLFTYNTKFVFLKKQKTNCCLCSNGYKDEISLIIVVLKIY